MSTHTLSPFPGSLVGKRFQVSVDLTREDWILRLHYRVKGPVSELEIPERSPKPEYLDGLYRHTCLEFFVMGKSKSYLEFNFSPSHDWAVFAFDSYRKRNEKVTVTEVHHQVDYEVVSKTELDFAVTVDLTTFQRFLSLTKQSSLRMGFSAVLESKEGEISYWAIWHPEDKADFHREENFSVIV